MLNPILLDKATHEHQQPLMMKAIRENPEPLIPQEKITEATRDALAVFSDIPEPPWTLASLQSVHRMLFKSARPDIAGKLRDSSGVAGETLATYANETIAFAQSAKPSAEMVSEIFVRGARFYALIVTTQLFERGNEYWGRLMVNSLLQTCGFYPGTTFEKIDALQLDWQVLRLTIFDDPVPLAETLLRGFLAQRQRYRDASNEQHRAIIAPRLYRMDPETIYRAHQRAYKRIGVRDLGLISTTFGASLSEIGDIFNVGQEAIVQWREHGVPLDHLAQLGRIAAVAHRLRRTFKRERVPELVREPNPGLHGDSVLAVLAQPLGADRVMQALDRMISYVPAPSPAE